MSFNIQFIFLATLELPDVSRLMNDPIIHSLYWTPVPTKIPSDCTKFDEKYKEDPQAHVMTYHLWFSSNFYVDDSIHLCIFHIILTGAAAKWYIKLPQGNYVDFNSLDIVFLTHFQLSVWYETDTDFLTSIKQDIMTHISNHIHKWRCRHHFIKFEIADEFLNEWFKKSLVNKIANDIAMGECVTEE